MSRPNRFCRSSDTPELYIGRSRLTGVRKAKATSRIAVAGDSLYQKQLISALQIGKAPIAGPVMR
jgi:hypothetical protein